MRYVGLDLHKKNSYFTVRDEKGNVLLRQKVESDEEEFVELIQQCESPISLVMEATSKF